MSTERHKARASTGCARSVMVEDTPSQGAEMNNPPKLNFPGPKQEKVTNMAFPLGEKAFRLVGPWAASDLSIMTGPFGCRPPVTPTGVSAARLGSDVGAGAAAEEPDALEEVAARHAGGGEDEVLA